MPLSNAGRDHIAKSLAGVAVTPFNNANAYIGIGNSSTAFDAAQTDLQGGSKIRKPMDTSYPTCVGNTMTHEATFGPNEANFAWYEWGLFNASAAGTMLNRVVEYNGTKLQGQTWILQVDVAVINAGA
jgi:hypothetical protein